MEGCKEEDTVSDKPVTVPSTPVVPVPAPQGSVRFHGHTGAQQGTRVVAPDVKYSDTEVQNLYERVKKAFKDMGHEF